MPITQTKTSDAALGAPDGEGFDGPAVLSFATGLPGFPAARTFSLEQLGPQLEPFARLRCLELPEVAFTVMPPGVLFPDYAVVVDEESVERLGIRSADDVVILAIVTLSVPPEPPKVNLLGPIVVNRRTLDAAQVVQHGSSYGVAVPLVATSERSAS